MESAIAVARQAFARRAWAKARDAFAFAGELDAADHADLAVAAYLTGADDECERAWAAAHRAALAAGDTAEAARCAFWLGLCLMLRGRMAQAGGWLGRADAIVAEADVECAASGYLLIPQVLQALHSGDAASAGELAEQAIDIGRHLGDPDLWAFGVLGLGQARIALGDIDAGMTRLDEVMVSVVAGEVGPITSGIVYCAVILECMTLFDLERASEWTGALSDWCDAQPDLVPYRGQCLVHRSQLQTAAGNWSEAFAACEAACRRLADPPHPALGLAYYQVGELHRLAGEFDRAEAAYRHASQFGQDPVPGLALLELMRGDVEGAAATIRRALHESHGPALLAAAVNILRAVGDVGAARSAANALSTAAADSPSPVLGAMASHARGAVLVAEGDAVAGLSELRAAARTWLALHMPYEAARTAVLIGLTCAALGDLTAAALEFDGARAGFAELGARPDLDHLDGLTESASTPSDASTLTDREREVLRVLATGKTNRQIAAVLHISQHTVGRHVENIFTKLAVTSRAAATARAYQLGVIEG